MKSTMFERKRPHAILLATIGLGLSTGFLMGGLGTAAARDRGPGGLAIGSAVSPYPTAAGPGFARLAVSAHSAASGLDPRGHVHARGATGAPMGAFTVSGPVTCLRVEDHKAAIKYRFSQASGSAATFRNGGVEIFIEDNGPPGMASPSTRSHSNSPSQRRRSTLTPATVMTRTWRTTRR